MKTFEEYLQEVFSDEGEIGGMPITKDNCDDMFDSWMQGFDVQEWLDYGIDYGRSLLETKKVTLGDTMKELDKVQKEFIDSINSIVQHND